MSRLIDLTGQTFNRWTVLARAENSKAGQTRWLCRCTCGNEAIVQAAALRDNHSKSCGCLKIETTVDRFTKHGHSSASGASPTYHSWAGMHARCTNSKHEAFRYYGGRGISVCKRWSDFQHFLEDMGEKPPGKSIDRIDVNGNYTPKNCQWATPLQQTENRRTK
jgi:hypothetical protein